MNIGSLLPRHARYRGAHLALVCGDARLSYAELSQRVNRLAHAFLALGLTKGDKIAIVVPNCVEVLETYWAAIQVGLVLVPLSPLLRGPALAADEREVRAAVPGMPGQQRSDVHAPALVRNGMSTSWNAPGVSTGIMCRASGMTISLARGMVAV